MSGGDSIRERVRQAEPDLMAAAVPEHPELTSVSVPKGWFEMPEVSSYFLRF